MLIGVLGLGNVGEDPGQNSDRCREPRASLDGVTKGYRIITDAVHAAAVAHVCRARCPATAPANRTAVEHRILTDDDRLFGLTGQGTA